MKIDIIDVYRKEAEILVPHDILEKLHNRPCNIILIKDKMHRYTLRTLTSFRRD